MIGESEPAWLGEEGKGAALMRGEVAATVRAVKAIEVVNFILTDWSCLEWERLKKV